ncbi:MAG: zinc metallopeptidase [Rhizobiaceae bacterium]
MLGILGFMALMIAIFAPQYWVQRQMKKHAAPRSDYPGTGGEFAEHLIEYFGLSGIVVEASDKGDHYDPESRTVRLSHDNFSKGSLTAVAVAAHEVGHALQHHRGERGLWLRQKLVGLASISDKIASVFFIAAPVLAIFARTPLAFFGLVGFGIALLAIRILVHLVTLPVEYDASFNKALPILREGGYLHEDDIEGARSVLKAAAYTYVAGALMSLFDLARWIRILR